MEKENINDVEGQNIQKNKKKRKKIILILLLLLLLLLGFLLWRYLTRDPGRLAREEDAIAGIIPGKDPADIQALLNQIVAEGMVDVAYNAEPTFEENGNKGNINIQNIPGNHYSFKVTLKLDENNKELYTSGLISPGYYVQYIKLNKKLNSGKHDATLIFDVYDVQDNKDELIGQINGKLTMNVSKGKFY